MVTLMKILTQMFIICVTVIQMEVIVSSEFAKQDITEHINIQWCQPTKDTIGYITVVRQFFMKEHPIGTATSTEFTAVPEDERKKVDNQK